MKKNNEMSKEDKWNAVISCDKRYDGLFYYAVKTTGIFCRPSCKAKAPLKKNILFFNSVDAALKAGFRPCKMCRPDVNEPIYEPNKELIKNTKKILEHSYNKCIDLKVIAKKLGYSDSHLTRLFKEYCSMTPNEYITKIRINKSEQLLKETSMDILVIAHEVGFKSLSTFYRCFKENVGSTPKEYRK